jgi:hypothetical protein
MSTTIPDLWSDDIKVTVLPPVAILRAQEGLLASKTQGILQAKLTTTESERLVQHQLDLIAPSLNFYRERLLSATHDREMVYPVTVTAACFSPRPRDLGEALAQVASVPVGLARNQRQAASQDEFIGLVREVLQSGEVRSLIQSLIARSNELRARQGGAAATDGVIPNGSPEEV